LRSSEGSSPPIWRKRNDHGGKRSAPKKGVKKPRTEKRPNGGKAKVWILTSGPNKEEVRKEATRSRGDARENPAENGKRVKPSRGVSWREYEGCVGGRSTLTNMDTGIRGSGPEMGRGD